MKSHSKRVAVFSLSPWAKIHSKSQEMNISLKMRVRVFYFHMSECFNRPQINHGITSDAFINFKLFTQCSRVECSFSRREKNSNLCDSAITLFSEWNFIPRHFKSNIYIVSLYEQWSDSGQARCKWILLINPSCVPIFIASIASVMSSQYADTNVPFSQMYCRSIMNRENGTRLWVLQLAIS